MARHKDANWRLGGADGGAGPTSWEEVTLAVLMDLRDELKQLNRVFGCQNALRIPAVLDQIAANTKKPKRRRKKRAAK